MNRKSGVADLVILVGMALITLVTICGRHGVTTRSIPVTVDVDVRGTNNTVMVWIEGQRVEVSGSGGVVLPVGGVK